ncbi:hypothetical protein I7I50_05996 [Histoplasma capsulatum G186AR]|nr:hypothetical protein I7I52_08735 [Histoplasma capsulatum]QSS67034.1 hypothetical protein I7I50_05996 [Histoplasma capsulatum G186AR]
MRPGWIKITFTKPLSPPTLVICALGIHIQKSISLQQETASFKLHRLVKGMDLDKIIRSAATHNIVDETRDGSTATTSVRERKFRNG